MCGILISALLAAPVAHAQSPQLGAGQVLGNSTAAQRPARAESLSAMLDRAFCSTANAMLARLSGSWVCLASANSSILVTNSSGVPAFGTTLPAFTLGGTVAGNSQNISNAGVIGGQSFSVSGTGGDGYTAYTGQSVNPATPGANNLRMFADATGRLSWIRSDGFSRTFDSTLTASRVYTLPDVTATLLYSGGPLGSPSTAGTMPAFVLGGAVTASGSRTYGIDLSGGTFSTGTILLPNAVPLQQKDSGGTARNLLNLQADGALIFGTGAHNIFVSVPATTGGFVPLTDNSYGNGGASNRWATVHTLADKLYGATSGVITLQATATAGTNTITLPAATGTVALTAGATIPTLATGDILYASAANTLSALADIATGNALISGGVGVAPSWGKIGISTHVSGLGTGVATALGTNVGSAGAPVVNGGALGTPSSGTLTSVTGLPISTGVSGLGTGIATALAVNTGSAGAPVLFNGAGGTPTSLVGTNITGTASGLTAGTVTTNANLTGDVTSVGNATTLATVASAGTTGSSTAIPVITINAKGLTTSITTAAVVAPAGTLTGATLASGVTASSLTSLGTITSLTATTINAFTLGGTIAGGGNQINNVIVGTTTPLAGFFTTASATTSLTSPLHIGGSGTTGTQLTFQTTTGVGTTDAFVWKRGNNGATVAATLDNTGLGLGTVAADTLLTLNANTAATVAVSLPSLLHLVGADTTEAAISMDTFGAVPRIVPRRANGTLASKTAIVSGDVLISFSPYGWDGSAYVNPANFQFLATENWSGSARGNAWRVFTTPNTTTTITEAIRVQASGGLSIGTTTDAGVGGLQINGQAFAPNMASDTATLDSTVCTATTGGKLLKGTGTLGICGGTSGLQFKTSLAPMAAGINELMRINFSNYRYRKGFGDDGARLQYGTTAQDVEAVMPDLVRHGPSGAAINYDSGALLFVGLRAIQQLKADNDNIRAELNDIKTRIAR